MKDFFKIILTVVMLASFAGCATVEVPEYLQDKNPYKKTFYADFDTTVNAITEILEKRGWAVENHYDPAIFEQNKESANPELKQIALFTKVRQTPFFIGTRYARLNAYVSSANHNVTEVEIRYLTVTSVPFKAFKSYRNHHTVDNILESIEASLK